MRFLQPLLAVQIACSLLLSLFCLNALAVADDRTTISGHPRAEALRLGEAMYRKGILPSGKQMTSIVQGDIELTGEMSTCANCHLRSGLGALEGGILSPPTNGARLYVPLRSMQEIPGSIMKRSMFKNGRPAYTRESLARMLLNGVGPGGVQLSETMPRYLLSNDEMEILIYYLESLSAQLSPGVTDDELRFATVVTEDISSKDRDALLLPLNAFVREEWNARLPDLRSRQASQLSGPAKLQHTYRKISLDVWELKGKPETWDEQLELYYRNRPVFAILGGIVPGKWKPVHDFCETNQIPCILPFTDLPVVTENDWYTLYFSKGLYQEGEAAAKYLSRVFALPADKKVIQLFRDNDAGNALSKGFADTWQKLADTPLINRSISAADSLGAIFWENISANYPDAVLLVWFDPADLVGVDKLAGTGSTKPTIFFSSTMLAGNYKAVPEIIRDLSLLTFPTRLPGDGGYAESSASNWLAFKKIPNHNMSITSKAYLITRLLSRVLIDMGGNLHRDFFLDIFDEGKDETSTSVLYPLLSFGPGQRYASKGCYVVTLSKDDPPKVLKQSDWVIY